jgi:hypothetical protein
MPSRKVESVCLYYFFFTILFLVKCENVKVYFIRSSVNSFGIVLTMLRMTILLCKIIEKHIFILH